MQLCCHDKPSTASFITMKEVTVQCENQGLEDAVNYRRQFTRLWNANADDETTATQLQHVLNQSGFYISLATIKHCGWDGPFRVLVIAN